MLGIHNILARSRILIRGSVPTYLCLTDLDPTPFFSDKDDKKSHFFIFFSYNLKLPAVFNLKFLFYKHYFSTLNTFMRKGKDQDPYLWLQDPGGLKTCGYGSPTLVKNVSWWPVGGREHVLLFSLKGQEWVPYSAPRHYSQSYTINILNNCHFDVRRVSKQEVKS